jgi:hypothetical protein
MLVQLFPELLINFRVTEFFEQKMIEEELKLSTNVFEKCVVQNLLLLADTFA